MRMYVIPAVSPSATDCFRRASSASSPLLVKPRAVGSATALCGHAGSLADAFAAVVDDLAGVVCACAAAATRQTAASQKLVRRSSVFTACPSRFVDAIPRRLVKDKSSLP